MEDPYRMKPLNTAHDRSFMRVSVENAQLKAEVMRLRAALDEIEAWAQRPYHGIGALRMLASIVDRCRAALTPADPTGETR
jgi:hypothetical protein